MPFPLPLSAAQFCPDPWGDLREVQRVLKPGGTLVLGLRLKNPARRFLGGLGHTEDEVAAIGTLLAEAGFTGISARRCQRGQERTAYRVAARKRARNAPSGGSLSSMRAWTPRIALRYSTVTPSTSTRWKARLRASGVEPPGLVSLRNASSRAS